MDCYLVYWFDTHRNLYKTLRFDDSAAPIKSSGAGAPVKSTGGGTVGAGDIAAFDRLTVAPDERMIYLKVNYYKEVYDELTNTRAGTAADGSVLWCFDVDTEKYVREINVPSLESDRQKGITDDRLYSLMGAAKNSCVFFYYPIEEGYSIMLLSAKDAARQRRGILNVAPEELDYVTFSLSGDGMLTALLASEWQAKVVWWRTDKLVEGVTQ
jgi:hypothetical protein